MAPAPSRRSFRRTLRSAVLAILLGLSAVASRAEPPPADGTVLSDEPCAALPAHEELDEFGRKYFDAATWTSIRGNTSIACRHLRYASGGVPVEGFLLLPPSAGAAQAPAILYNRGGTGDFGRIDHLLLAEMRLLAAEGFVVAATNTRYVGPLAHRDEWGGADLDDVLNLVPLLRARADVDGCNLFMLGLSRGGLMTYLALKRDAPIEAAAVIAGPTDLTRFIVDRPEFLLGWEGYDGWAKVWADFGEHGREILEARSPVFWPELIRKPVLILHSRTDPKVPVEAATGLAAKLQAAGREYELLIYGHDGHSLPLHRADRNRRIVEWFRSHRRL